MNFEQARFNMIEQQIRPWEVLDTQVLALLAMVKREDFVPKIHQSLAFADLEIPLPPHSDPSQCMLSPKVEARLLQDLGVQKHEKVLEIGAGSGYMAALLAHRAQQVITLEIEPTLAAMARDKLRQAGIYNAQVLEVDGAGPLSAPELTGSFDVILDDGKDKKRVHLNRSYNGLYVCPMIWRELDNFSSGSVCMVLASNKYDEADYFRDYAEFMRARWGA